MSASRRVGRTVDIAPLVATEAQPGQQFVADGAGNFRRIVDTDRRAENLGHFPGHRSWPPRSVMSTVTRSIDTRPMTGSSLPRIATLAPGWVLLPDSARM